MVRAGLLKKDKATLAKGRLEMVTTLICQVLSIQDKVTSSVCDICRKMHTGSNVPGRETVCRACLRFYDEYDLQQIFSFDNESPATR
jgi:hypothetical protein